MSETHSDTKITIRTEAPEAGPTSLIAGCVCWVFAAAIAIGAMVWLGYPVATDINSRDFNPLPFFFFVCFAAVGTFLLFRGVLHSLRYRQYGSSVLEMSEARLGQTAYVKAEGVNSKGKKFVNFYHFTPCGDHLVLAGIAENPQ